MHMDKIFRQIRTVCSYEKCGEIVVDVQRTEPHEGGKSSCRCEECDSKFNSNYQKTQH